MTQQKHKPIISTLINTSAIAIAVVGVTTVQGGSYKGMVLVAFAAGLEWFKYWGVKKNYW